MLPGPSLRSAFVFSINSLILSAFPLASYHLAEASLSAFSWLYTHVCAVAEKYRGAWFHPFFCVAKRKKRNKGKKERVSKQKLFKGCYQDQNVTVLAILEHLEFKNCSCRPPVFHGPPPLVNQFRRPWFGNIFVWKHRHFNLVN